MLYGTNKICGITTKEALNAAIDVHASIAGFIFFEKSVRNISVERAVEFADSARGKIRFAGVFVNESLDTVELIAKKAGLDYVQLHGCEDLEYITNLKNRLPNTKIIKALNIESSDDFSKIDYYNDSCEYIILDSKAPGSGSSFDWNSIPDCVNKNKILLSGGIGIDHLCHHAVRSRLYRLAGMCEHIQAVVLHRHLVERIYLASHRRSGLCERIVIKRIGHRRHDEIRFLDSGHYLPEVVLHIGRTALQDGNLAFRIFHDVVIRNGIKPRKKIHR